MGDIGTPISETIPAVGTSGTAYATGINAFLTEVKNRLEAEVPRSSLEDGDLDLNGEALQNAKYVGLANQVFPTGPSGSVQVSGGNLYFINTGGAVQLTSGTSLNTALLGGITGDYGGANPAQFRFVDADQEYYAYDDYAGGAWARLWAKNFDLAAGPTSSNRVRFAFSGGASYTLTVPSAPPGAVAFLQMDTSGNVTANNTITQRVTATDFRYTTAHSRWLPHASYCNPAGSHAFQLEYWTLGNTSNALYIPVVVENNEKIEEWGIYINKNSASADVVTARLWRHNDDGTKTQVGTTQTNNANFPGNTMIGESGLTEVVGSSVGVGYTITIEHLSGTNVQVFGAFVHVSRP